MEFILKKEPHTTLWTEKIALLHSEKGKLLATQSIPKMQSLNTHTHTFAYLWVSHRGSCIALHQPTSFIVKRVPFICHLHASLEDVSGEHETCLVIIRHLSWLQDKRRLKEMYSPCQLWIRLSFIPNRERSHHTSTSVSAVNKVFFYTHMHIHRSVLRQLSTAFLYSDKGKLKYTHWKERLMSTVYSLSIYTYTLTHKHTEAWPVNC